MLWFYIVDAVVHAAVATAFVLSYRSTQAREYKHLGVAAGVIALSSILLAVLGDGFELVNTIFIYLSLIVYLLATLVYNVTVLHLWRAWLQSVQNAPRPRAYKVARAEKVMRVLRMLYVALTLLLVVFAVLLLVTLMWATVLALTVGVLYTLLLLFQLAVLVWLWLDVQVVGNESELHKRNQLLRLVALTFFAAWPMLFSATGTGIGTSLCWWIWYGIALWPKALVGYDEEPRPAVPAAYGSTSDK